MTVNRSLDVDQYPLPKPGDLFAMLAGGDKFSKIDLASAYQQFELDEESQELVALKTHKGLYRPVRMPFGIANAPAVFQKIMDRVLRGPPRVVCYLDDILVTGENDDEHLKNSRAVLDRLRSDGLCLKRAKCAFMAESVEYFGYVVDRNGLHATPGKIRAIQNAPRPTDVKQLSSFLGRVNYYGKFIPQLATLEQPLTDLLANDAAFEWTERCEKAFTALKEKLASADVLVRYDAKLPLRLACDAFANGLGAVLSHIMMDGSERPIAYGSKTLTATERKYSQIEKEAYALKFGVTKFAQYLCGRRFTLVTDHRPFVTIFGRKGSLSTIVADRMQRWAVLLSMHTFDIEYKTSSANANADGFSRLPLDL